MADHPTRSADPRTDSLAAPPVTTGGDTPTAAGRYELGEEIARGGMGAVYRASDAVLGREVAVKVLLGRYAAGSAAARRFADEARITGQLQHPGVPPVHDLGTLPDGRPFLAMKLIKGDTLADLLTARPDPGADRGRFLAVFEGVCQAVGYAHAHGVVHRDLKPGNVMVGTYGEVQVMDWGLAKVLTNPPREQGPADPEETGPATAVRSGRESDGAHTEAGSVLGTPAFMPPEQAIGAVDQVDRRSDVFGLGAVLAAVLTGQPPFMSGTAESTRQLAARGKVDECFARLDASGADPDLVALCKRCLAAEKADRPRDAGEVAKAVADLRAAADERVRRAATERAAAEAEAREGRKRRRVQVALAAAVGLLAAGGLAAAWWQDRQAADRAAERQRAEAEKEAAALRQQLADERRAADERARLARTADAVGALVGQAEAALGAGDAETAALALGAAERQAAEGGADHLAGRLAAARADLALLRELDRVDGFRWTFVGRALPAPPAVAARLRAALAAAGLDPAGDPAEVARRVGASRLRGRLVTALDTWLVLQPAAGVREALRALDPDAYRDQVRDAAAAADGGRVAELADRPEALAQPPGFAAALGVHPAVPVARRRAVLRVALDPRPGDLSLLLTLANTYPFDPKDPGGERLRWSQAAVSAHPRSLAALNNLGIALAELRRIGEAVACFEGAVRLAPDDPQGHYNLGVARFDTRDWDGAAAGFREAARLLPSFSPAHHNLGDALRNKGDQDGAVAAYREAVRQDPRNARALTNLGVVLRARGDVDGAVAAYRESARVDPTFPQTHFNLGNVLAQKGDWDGAAASFREAVRLAPDDPDAKRNLAAVLKAQADRDARRPVAPPPRPGER